MGGWGGGGGGGGIRENNNNDGTNREDTIAGWRAPARGYGGSFTIGVRGGAPEDSVSNPSFVLLILQLRPHQSPPIFPYLVPLAVGYQQN